MFDIKAVEAEAQAELDAERAKDVKSEVKSLLRQIADSEKITANLRLKYAAKLRELAA